MTRKNFEHLLRNLVKGYLLESTHQQSQFIEDDCEHAMSEFIAELDRCYFFEGVDGCQ